jgi:hypothetical protein
MDSGLRRNDEWIPAFAGMTATCDAFSIISLLLFNQEKAGSSKIIRKDDLSGL